MNTFTLDFLKIKGLPVKKLSMLGAGVISKEVLFGMSAYRFTYFLKMNF